MPLDVPDVGHPRRGQAICPYCGVGCRLWVESMADGAIGVKGVADAPANRGDICAKGATLPQVIRTPDRLTRPLWRDRRVADFRPMEWGHALESMAARFRAIIDEHGPDAADQGLVAGQMAALTSRRGDIRLPVRLNPGLSRGLVFVPFHWGDDQGDQTAVNYLTIPAIGRVAKQPELKFCAVRLAPATEALAPEPSYARTSRVDRPRRPVVVEATSAAHRS